MIAFMLLAPMIFLSALMSMFAAVAGILAATFAFVVGPLVGAVVVGSTALLGALIFILS
ncbi:MAG: hypothetical protein OEV57_04140 [Dehalococcoidia bacterium]|nr:hypothetical protein [Dehalococcoidia bacterium]MDH4367308.1 hypothetical protein [Dehalococcoidia bacterium]